MWSPTSILRCGLPALYCQTCFCSGSGCHSNFWSFPQKFFWSEHATEHMQNPYNTSTRNLMEFSRNHCWSISCRAHPHLLWEWGAVVPSPQAYLFQWRWQPSFQFEPSRFGGHQQNGWQLQRTILVVSQGRCFETCTEISTSIHNPVDYIVHQSSSIKNIHGMPYLCLLRVLHFFSWSLHRPLLLRNNILLISSQSR